MSETSIGGGPQQPDEISEGDSDLAAVISTLEREAEADGSTDQSINQWLKERPETRLVQVLPSGHDDPRVRLDRLDVLPEEVDVIIGELTALRAWLARRPR